MALDLTNFLNVVTVKEQSIDSDTDGLRLLQLRSTAKKFGKTKYYDSAGELPAMDSDLRGMTAHIQSPNIYSGSGIYLATGEEWYQIYDLNTPVDNVFFQGTNYGFSLHADNGNTASIEKYNFSNSVTTTTVDPLISSSPSVGASSIRGGGGATDIISGYAHQSGGDPGDTRDKIKKFSMISYVGIENVGTLATATEFASNQSDVRGQVGYVSGGAASVVTPSPSIFQSEIEKWSMASDGNASVAGDLTVATERPAGITDTVNGYGWTGGGRTPPITALTNIERFPFSSPFTTTTDVADLSFLTYNARGLSSSTHGFVSGGLNPALPGSFINTNKFSFVGTSPVSVDIAAQVGRIEHNTSSSTEHGYITSGHAANAPASIEISTIERFSFSNEPATVENVGSLNITKQPVRGGSGHQY